MGISPKDIRNIAIIGHGGTGKTTLCERLLFDTRTTTRFGRPSDGTSILDVAADEKERGASIDMHLCHYQDAGCDVTLIDTPGAADFAGEPIAALEVVETALVCIDAKAGIKVGTRKLWQRAQELGTPRVIAVTRTDVEQADFGAVVKQCQEAFGEKKCIPLYLPNASGPAFTSLEPVLELRPDASARAKKAHDALVDAAIEHDEALTARYLEGETLSLDEIRHAFTEAVVAGLLDPMIPVSAETGAGIAELRDAIVKLFPSPADRLGKATRDGKVEAIPLDAPFTALCFKVVNDQAGRLAHLRVYSGSLENGQPFHHMGEKKDDKGGHLFRAQGNHREKLDHAVAGMIICIPKLDTLKRGDTIEAHGVELGAFPMPPFPTPLAGFAVSPKRTTDAPKLLEDLHKLEQEDPTFKVVKNVETGQLLIEGLSQLHLNVLVKRLHARWNVDVETAPRRIPYRETITTSATERYRHKKQSGGAGEFAEVELKIDPLPRDKGFEYAWEVVGMAVSRNFGPSIEKGIHDVMQRGAIAGYPVVDVKAAVTDGKEHPVDSKDRAFQKAGREAFKAAIKKAKPVILEPIVKLEVHVPGEKVGDVQSDLGGARRAHITNTEFLGNEATVSATVPLAEIMTYDQHLRSMTAGEGSYSFTPSHYDFVPHQIQAQLVAEFEKHRVEEKD